MNSEGKEGTKYQLVAIDKNGNERATVSFGDEPWDVFELFDIIEGWMQTDIERRVIICPFPKQNQMNSDGGSNK